MGPRDLHSHKEIVVYQIFMFQAPVMKLLQLHGRELGSRDMQLYKQKPTTDAARTTVLNGCSKAV